MLKRAQVDAYQQKTEWTCSAATLKASLAHYGIDISEEDAVEAIGASKGRGAETTDIVEGAKKLGYDAWEQSFSSLEAARDTLRQGIPIIADVQSFNYPGKGHYVLIAGYKPGKGFIVMDPNTKGKTAVDNWRVVPDKKMEEIWWDRAMAPPHQLMPKWGVMVRPTMDKTASGDMLEYFQKNPKKYKEYQARQKAKEKKANDPIKEKRKIHGIPVHLEWRKGETRTYYQHDPLKKTSKNAPLDYKKHMKADYGYIPRVKDADGEELDVYVGPNPESKKVTVIDQLRPTDNSFDEHKVMIGFDSKAEAIKSYRQHMAKKYLGKARIMTISQFKEKFLSKKASDPNDYKHLEPGENPVPGGLFDKKKVKPKLPTKALRKGLKVELEHTSDPNIAEDVTRDHLTEDEGYYDKLDRIEKKAIALVNDRAGNKANVGRSARQIAGSVGAGIGGVRAALDENSSLLKGLAGGAIVGALIATGLHRQAMGKTTLPGAMELGKKLGLDKLATSYPGLLHRLTTPGARAALANPARAAKFKGKLIDFIGKAHLSAMKPGANPRHVGTFTIQEMQRGVQAAARKKKLQQLYRAVNAMT